MIKFDVILFLLTLLPAIAVERTACALDDACADLTKDQLALAGSLKTKAFCYDCCDETVAKCLKKKKPCRLAVRLSNEICLRVKKGQDEEKILGALDKRAKSMMPGAKIYTIDTSALDTWAGESSSKVVLQAYLCTRCPYCSKLAPKLHKAVTNGRLKGKVRIHARMFPIKSHKDSVTGGLAVVAAAKQGKFWPYLLKVYQSFDDFAPDKLAAWAKKIGLDEAKFKAAMKAEETRKLLEASKKEGLKNGVEGTPSFFINGKRYVADQGTEFFFDALEEEHDRMTGSLYVEVKAAPLTP
jgi:protein-disulfide isomerase